jgi:hypothetical protein
MAETLKSCPFQLSAKKELGPEVDGRSEEMEPQKEETQGQKPLGVLPAWFLAALELAKKA